MCEYPGRIDVPIDSCSKLTTVPFVSCFSSLLQLQMEVENLSKKLSLQVLEPLSDARVQPVREQRITSTVSNRQETQTASSLCFLLVRLLSSERTLPLVLLSSLCCINAVSHFLPIIDQKGLKFHNTYSCSHRQLQSSPKRAIESLRLLFDI